MTSKRLIVSIVFGASLALVVYARPSILNDFQDHYPATTIPQYTEFATGDECLDCHVSQQRSEPGNAYRIDLITTNHDFVGLDPVDSDGDGVSNAVEATTPRVDPPLDVDGTPQVGYNPGLIDCPGGELGYDPFSMQVITGVSETPPGGKVWTNENPAVNCADGLDNDCDGLQDAADVDDCLASVGSGAVPDGFNVVGTPLMAARGAGGTVDLNWDASCRSTDTDYEVYEGAIGTFYSHQLRLCSTGGLTNANVAPLNTNAYFIVVPTDGSGEGSYGLDSGVTPRPVGIPACLPQVLASPVCP